MEHLLSHVKHPRLAAATLALILLLTVMACAPQAEADPEQFTIGLISNSQNGLRNVQGFRDRMIELGYIEGENVTYLFAGSPTSAELLENALQEMVASEVDLIFTSWDPDRGSSISGYCRDGHSGRLRCYRGPY